MIREQLEALSPIQPACLVDGRRPACQSGLADLIRSQDAADLLELLAKIADTHAFSWDAYDMLGRVCDYLFAESLKKSLSQRRTLSSIVALEEEERNGIQERF